MKKVTLKQYPGLVELLMWWENSLSDYIVYAQ